MRKRVEQALGVKPHKHTVTTIYRHKSIGSPTHIEQERHLVTYFETKYTHSCHDYETLFVTLNLLFKKKKDTVTPSDLLF